MEKKSPPGPKRWQVSLKRGLSQPNRSESRNSRWAAMPRASRAAGAWARRTAGRLAAASFSAAGLAVSVVVGEVIGSCRSYEGRRKKARPPVRRPGFLDLDASGGLFTGLFRGLVEVLQRLPGGLFDVSPAD